MAEVRPELSAGRVQSVAVRLIVERERQRMAFREATWWDLIGRFGTAGDERFAAGLISFDGRRIPAGKDFDPATGQIKDPVAAAPNRRGPTSLAERLRQAEFRVADLDNKPYTTKPYPPFTTSTLQQEANRKLGLHGPADDAGGPKLVRDGHITYMRTDSTNLASVAIDAARDLVRTQYGEDSARPAARLSDQSQKRAGGARSDPAGRPSFRFSRTARGGELSAEEFKLYDLIWKRTVASQMADARGHRITITSKGTGRFSGQRQDGRFPRLPAGVRGRKRRSRKPAWRKQDVLPP